MREVERSAESVEEAIEAALDELGVSEQEAEVEIVRDPGRGFLGLKTQRAVVRVRVPDEWPSEAEQEEEADIAEAFLEGLLELMGMDAELDHHEVEGVMYVDILSVQEPEAMGLLIGRHGHTLDALQDLVRSTIQRRTQRRCRLMVDVEDYRKRRRAQLAARGREVARRVVRSGKKETLEPMNAFERKTIHDAAAQIKGVETVSEGEEPNRQVVVRKKR